MIYDVKGTVVVKHKCDCDLCTITEQNVEVNTRLIAVDKIQASAKALAETVNWIKWLEEPTVTEVKIPFNKDIPLRNVAGFVTDGYIAIKKELVGDVETKPVAKAPDWITEAKRQVHLGYQGNTDYNAVVYASLDETEVLIDELYREMINRLGLYVYSKNDPVQPLEPVLLVDGHTGEVVGFVAPMLEN